MFPMQITLNIANAEQLRALAAISGDVKVVESSAARTTTKPADTKADTAKKSDAATGNAATQTTAETSGAQEKKAESSAASVMSVDERAALVKSKVAAGGRDTVVALLKKYGAAKASEIAEEKLADFDAELKSL